MIRYIEIEQYWQFTLYYLCMIVENILQVIVHSLLVPPVKLQHRRCSSKVLHRYRSPLRFMITVFNSIVIYNIIIKIKDVKNIHIHRVIESSYVFQFVLVIFLFDEEVQCIWLLNHPYVCHYY